MWNASQCYDNAIAKYDAAEVNYDDASFYFEEATNDNAVFYYGVAENYFDSVISLYNGGAW